MNTKQNVFGFVALIILALTFIFQTQRSPDSIEHFSAVSSSPDQLEQSILKAFKKIANSDRWPLEQEAQVPHSQAGLSSLSGDQLALNWKYRPRVYWFNIQSNKRDQEKFPFSNRYEYHFPSKLNNIETIELINAKIPRGQYIIDQINRWMDIRITFGALNQVISVELPVGNYNITDYIISLQNAFNANPFLINITIAFAPLTSTITFQHTGPGIDTFTLLYATGVHRRQSNFHELGFSRKDLGPVGPALFPAPGSFITGKRVDFSGVNCLNIVLKEVEYSDRTQIVSSIPIHPSNPVTIFQNPVLYSKRTLKPTINLFKLTISFVYDPPEKEPALYNFNGFENEVTLEITTREYVPPFLEPPLRQVLPIS